MDWTTLVSALAIVTLLAFVIIAMVSKKKTEERKKAADAPKSTLAKDKDSHGNRRTCKTLAGPDGPRLQSSCSFLSRSYLRSFT